MTKAIYPGSFDPPTRGHLDVIDRCRTQFESLVVAIGNNSSKQPLFSAQERAELLRAETSAWPHVSVAIFQGLVVDFARAQGATVLLRGIRTVGDYEYEFAMACTNRSFAGDIETFFVMPGEAYMFTAGRLVREVAALGGDVSRFVTPRVAARLRDKLGQSPGAGT